MDLKFLSFVLGAGGYGAAVGYFNIPLGLITFGGLMFWANKGMR